MSRVSKSCELIKRRRLQLALHSYIYYELNDNCVSDNQWQAWAQELIELQAKHPHHTDQNDSYFKGWDGTTGYHLCQLPDIRSRAEQVRRYAYEQDK